MNERLRMKKKPNPQLEAALRKTIDGLVDLAKAYNDMGWFATADDAASEAESYKRTLNRLMRKK